MPDDPHKVLGLQPDASEEEIRSAYRTLARKLHPDASGSHETAEAFGKVTEAYDALRERARSEGAAVPVRRGRPSPARVPAEPLAARRRRPSVVAEPLRSQQPGGEPPGWRARTAAPLHGPRAALSDLLPLLWLLDPDYFD